MKRILSGLTLSLLLAFSFAGKAQDTIGFGPTGFSGMPDSVWSGEYLPVGAFLKNYSSSPYNNFIQITGLVDSGGIPVPLVFPPVNYQIPGNDSLFVINHIDFTAGYLGGIFAIGNNTIVIWPILFDPNWNTGDSLRATVFVMDSIVGVNDLADESSIRCYPVPSSGLLYLTSSSRNLVPESAIIRSSTGEIVFRTNTPLNAIDVSTWSPGVYFIEVTFENGRQGVYKIMRE